MWKNSDAPDGLRVVGQWVDFDLQRELLNERKGSEKKSRQRTLPAMISGTNRDEALFRAAREGDFGEIDRLVIQGSRIGSMDRDGNTLLIVACSYGLTDLIEPLLMMGLDVDARDRYGRTALIQAVDSGDFTVIGRLSASPARKPD